MDTIYDLYVVVDTRDGMILARDGNFTRFTLKTAWEFARKRNSYLDHGDPWVVCVLKKVESE